MFRFDAFFKKTMFRFDAFFKKTMFRFDAILIEFFSFNANIILK